MLWQRPASGYPKTNSPTPTAAHGIPGAVVFATKPRLARAIVAAMVADGSMPPWAAGDEVYGRSSELRGFLEDNEIGCVVRVFKLGLVDGVKAMVR